MKFIYEKNDAYYMIHGDEHKLAVLITHSPFFTLHCINAL